MDYIEPDDGTDAQTVLEEAGDENAALHEEALKRFDQIIHAVQEERALALRDRRFATIAGAQWEGIWGEQFENSIMVEVNKTAAGLEKIIADYRANRFIVDFRASDDDSDPDTADLLNGMFRADLYDSCGQSAIDTAFEEGVQGGIGAWRLKCEWEDEYDPENDYQRIRFELIPDADQRVFWDPNAKQYDKRDARYCFVLTAMGLDAYEEEYGENVANFPTGIFKTHYDWYTPQVAYVAEYYEVREKEGKLYVLRNKATGSMRREWAADLEDGELEDLKQQGWVHVRTRRGKRKQIWKTTLSGSGVLKDPQLIAGRWIPVIPFYGKRWFVDNMERSRGHVRFAVDPQRIYNAQISKLTETAAASPIERPIVTPEQIAGHSDDWAEMNLKRAPYAVLNPMIDPATGQMIATGPIGKIEPPNVSPAVAALIQITASDVAELTAADDGADQVQANVSAEAMDIAAQRTDSKAEIYMDNLRQSYEWCGRVYYAMATDVYVEEGRSVPVRDANGQDAHKTLLEAYADDKGYRIRHDIGRGKYAVVADVTEATTTRRDKTAKTCIRGAEIAGAVDPQLAGVLLNTAILNTDGEGMEDVKDWVRKRLITQGVIKPTPEEAQELAKQAQAQGQQPPSAQDQLASAKAQGELASAELDRAKTVLTLAQARGEGAKTENDIALARLESAHAQQDQMADHAQRRQQMTHAEQAHGLDMAQGVQAIGHAEQAHRVGLVERLRNMFAPKPAQGGQ